MSHTFFIAASYGVSLLGLAFLAGWMLISYRREQRLLGELEARGVRRRSRAAEPGKGEPTKGEPTKGEPTKGEPTNGEASRGEAAARPVVGVK